MTVYEPAPMFTVGEKRLLLLLAKLLVESLDKGGLGSNRPKSAAALSDIEAEELVTLIDGLSESESFSEAAMFVEGLTQPSGNEKELRGIFIKGRDRRGRSGAMDWTRWYEFLSRLGRNTGHTPSIEPMPIEYFQRMEVKLLASAGVPSEARNAVIQLIKRERNHVEAARSGRRAIPSGTIRQVITGLCPGSVRKEMPMHVSATRIAAGLTIIADTSVLFTTRDWGVAGTLSTMAGALPAMAVG